MSTGIEHKPGPTHHLPAPRPATTPHTAPSSQAPAPRRRRTSNPVVSAQLPDDFIAIRSIQEGSDEGPRFTVMPRSALLQRTFSTALEYLAPQISNATFTTRDMPGFEGTSVNIAPEHWNELLPLTKLMDAKLPPRDEVQRAEKPVVSSPKKNWRMNATPLNITALVLVLLIIAICGFMYYL